MILLTIPFPNNPRKEASLVFVRLHAWLIVYSAN